MLIKAVKAYECVKLTSNGKYTVQVTFFNIVMVVCNLQL